MWTSLGEVGTAVFGMVFLQESTQALKLVSIALVVAGELLMDEGFASLDQLVHDAVLGLAAGWLAQADDVVDALPRHLVQVLATPES